MSDEERHDQTVTPATWAGKRRAGDDPATDPPDEAPPPDAELAPDAEVAPDADAPPEAQAAPGAAAADESEREADAESEAEAKVDATSNGAGTEETIEADTLAVADAEEAKEAALAGLRQRTSEHAARREAAEGPASADGDGGAPAAEAEAETEAEVEVPAPPTPVAPAQPEDDQEPPKRSLWPRFVAASFLIVASVATATAVSILVYLTDFAKGLGGLEGLRGNLAAVEAGKPQNFLLLGSDKRADEADRGRSDTTLLLRINPDEGEHGVITMMSIPRDLRVNIQGLGISRFNEAYTVGGPKLTLKTVQQLTDDRIPINHVVNVGFLGFADAVNAIGCVYVDVDRHYYVPPNSGVAEIDIEAGYQRLCGLKALQYVRYRHTDTDLVRSARQQDFLREARQAVPPGELLDNWDKLKDIITSYTTSDINSGVTLLNLGKLVFSARNAPVQEIHFPTTSLNDNGYVTSSDELVQKAVSQFLDPIPDEARGGGGKAKGAKPKHEKETKPEPPPEVALIDSTGSGQQYAELFQNTKTASGKPMLRFPVFYPTRLVPGSAIDDESRAYVIDGPGDEVYHGYQFVVTMPGPPGGAFPTAYYGISGTDWKDPPILESPSEEREINGRRYELYYDGDRLRLIAWHTDKGSYWVINTLTQQLGEAQMVAIANNVREYTG